MSPFHLPDLKTVIENAANPENAALAPWFALAERAVVALETQAAAVEKVADLTDVLEPHEVNLLIKDASARARG